jgi:RimJ/RimL family protein N-acetyltransferase
VIDDRCVDTSHQSAFQPRQVALPHGSNLLVRAVEPADVDGLARLYDGLDLDDRYRRFFAVFRPQRPFFERMANAVDHGAFGMVAVVTEATGDATIVGEANYCLEPNGDGELALTVARSWRGWLGPYLLDALLEAAAANGVPNLEAEVLAENRSMLALLRSRGYATMDHPDWTVVRVVISSTDHVPTWPGPHDQPRVLVEVAGGRWRAEETARKAGLQVLACPGPADRRWPCPALAGGTCPLAAGADVIIVSHAADEEPWASLCEAHHRAHPAVPVYVESRLPTGDEAERVAFVENVARRHASCSQLRRSRVG